MDPFLKIRGVSSSQTTWTEKRELGHPGTSGYGHWKKEKWMSSHPKEDVSPGVPFMQILIEPSRGRSYHDIFCR